MNKPVYYQEEACASVLGELITARSTLLVMATGLGKTVCISNICKTWPGNILVLAHRDELITQAWKRIEADTGEWVEIEKAESHSYVARIVVGSVQSLTAKRLQKWKRSHFTLVIVDESHHAVSKSYRTILDYFNTAKVLGVTATPDRGDGVAIGLVFETVAYQFDLLDGISDGWLVPIRGHREHLDELDISGVSKNAGELAPGELDDAIVLAVDAMVRKTVELYPDKRVLFFFPGIRSAELAAEKLNLLDPGSAIVVSGKTPTEERQQLVSDYRAGKYRYFCNCMIATEGFDVPGIDVVAMCRPTLSASLFMQMIGRGTRPGCNVYAIDGLEGAAERKALIAGSPKPHMTILDFVGNSGRHKDRLLGIEDILGGKYSVAERALAKKAAEEATTGTDGSYDPLEALARAREELARMAAIQMPVIASRTELFDPFADAGGQQTPFLRRGRDGRSATEGQLRELMRLGVSKDEAETMSVAQASRFMNACRLRRAQGLASYKQLSILRDFGVTSRAVPALVASEAIAYLQQARYRKSPEVKAEVQRIITQTGVTETQEAGAT